MKQVILIRHDILLSERKSERHPHLNPLPSRERKLDQFASGGSLKIGKKTAAVTLVYLCIVLAYSASAAERKSDLRVTYRPPHISVEARGAKLRDVLRDVSQKVGFELTDYGIPDRDVTVSIEETTLEELLRQLLRGENYGVVYREKDR